MPGRQVKHWSKYHALRKKGYPKGKAARIANSGTKKSRRKRKKK